MRLYLALLRQRQGARLITWANQVAKEGYAALQRFATGLRDDWEAVVVGLTREESNGATEGQMHRLKLLKRECYGRAGFATLRARVLQS